MYKVTTLHNVIEDLKALRGAEVRIFGQAMTLYTETTNEDLYLDTVEVLERLTHFEADTLRDEIEEDFDGDIYDWAEAMENAGLLKEVNGGQGNTYNWNAPLNHHVDFTTYSHEDGSYIVTLKAHRYGDLRGNYTEVAVLQFDNDWEWAEEFYHQSKFVDVRGFEGRVSALVELSQEGARIYENDTENEYESYAADMDDLVEEVTAWIKELDAAGEEE